ncbi:MAG: hypothetical protein ACI8ZX_001203 [Planctomycetota bacterium]|jgi:hypothetical protein
MRLNKQILSILFLLVLPFMLFSQEEKKKKPKKKFKDILAISGYVKYLNTTSFTDADNLYNDNLIHNRINLKAYFGNHFEVEAGIRNRIFYGETMKLNPLYGAQLEEDNGLIDLSWNLIDRKAFIINTKIDRLYVNFYKGKFDIKLGRQRINWGISNLWNPNDLFNAYNFLDFDYEERPGTDALRFSFFPTAMSSIEFAYQPEKTLAKSIIALMYKFNLLKYDFQVLAANYKEDLALGLGWAGSIKDAGFKGEATYFHNRTNFANSQGVFTGTLGLDYSFKDGIYANVGFLYNSEGVYKRNANFSLLSLYTQDLSAKNLMPTRYTFMGQASKAFGQAWNVNLTSVYGTGIHLWMVIPTVSYSIKENWDIDLTVQTFFAQQRIYKNLGNSVNLRLRFSY